MTANRSPLHQPGRRIALPLVLLLSGLCALALGARQIGSASGPGLTGAVYTASNEVSGNQILYFQRSPAGQLEYRSSFSTGGTGSGGGLGNQGAVALDRANRLLLAVNAGSDSISVFEVGVAGLTLVDVESSRGSLPISVTTHGDLVYVLNAGGDGNIAGFQLTPHGSLQFLPGSIQPLSGSGTGPAQIGFSSDGRFLVVTEKATDSIVTFAVGDDGVAEGPNVNASQGVTPFGFDFGHRGRLLVSEASGGAPGLSSVSSYDLLGDGSLAPITAALPTTQSAACWLVINGNGRYAWVTNTGSDTVTGLAVARDGELSLLDPDGVTAPAGDAPIDAATTRDGRYLYVLNGADDSISGYRTRADGSLEPVGEIDGLPASVNGLAAF